MLGILVIIHLLLIFDNKSLDFLACSYNVYNTKTKLRFLKSIRKRCVLFTQGEFLWSNNVFVCVLVTQSCLTLGNPMDCSPPGSSVHGILQGYWNGLPCPPPGDLPDPAIKPESLMSPALAGGFFTTNATWEALYVINTINKNYSLPFSCLWQICCPEPKKCLFPRKWQEGGYTPGHRGTSDWFWGLYIWPLVKSNKWLTDRLRTVPAMHYTWTT